MPVIILLSLTKRHDHIDIYQRTGTIMKTENGEGDGE
jgi:hypothetical protein